MPATILGPANDGGIKYIVIPGSIQSKNDGDVHYISSGQLTYLYMVSPSECVVWHGPWDHQAMLPYEGCLKLVPRFDGEYLKPDSTPNAEPLVLRSAEDRLADALWAETQANMKEPSGDYDWIFVVTAIIVVLGISWAIAKTFFS